MSVLGVMRARITAPTALLIVALCDSVLARTSLSLPVQGAIDETAHLSTTVLLLLGLALRLNDRVFVATALAASVLIDTDHVPGTVFGNMFLTAGTARPYTHSLLTPIVLLAASRLLRTPAWRTAALGAAFGVGSHLLRDLATGPGVPLLWPASDSSATVPYPAYAAVAAALCLGALLRSPAAAAASGPAASPSRP